MIRLAMVEDEELYIQQLVGYLERYQKESGNEFKVTRFRDGDEIVEDYCGDYDIILLDIQMKFMDGMTAAEKIRKMDQEVIIMFITNMTQYAIRGYEVDALDYMVKPIEYFAFSQKLGRAIERMRHRDRQFISIPIDVGVQKLDIEGIYYIESQGHNLIYKTKKGEFISRGTMKELENIMVPYGFFRSNKGYLVNMKYVDKMQENCCVIQGEQLPVSRAKRKEFMESLANYMSEVIK